MLYQIWEYLLITGVTSFILGYWLNDITKPITIKLPEEQLQRLDTLITKLSNKKGGRPKGSKSLRTEGSRKIKIGLHR